MRKRYLNILLTVLHIHFVHITKAYYTMLTLVDMMHEVGIIQYSFEGSKIRKLFRCGMGTPFFCE